MQCGSEPFTQVILSPRIFFTSLSVFETTCPFYLGKKKHGKKPVIFVKIDIQIATCVDILVYPGPWTTSVSSVVPHYLFTYL